MIGSLALAAPASSIAGGLTVVLQAKDQQKASQLEVKVTCPEERCHVTLHGNAKADDEKFKLRPRDRTLPAEEKERFRLEIRDRRELEELLAEGDGQATVRLRAVDSEGVVAKTKVRIALSA